MMSDSVRNTNQPQILVVDDSPTSLKLLTDILTNQDYQVRPASDGTLALRSVAVEAPDLILLDVKMPGMDGYETCRHIKSDAKGQGVPVIFISGLEDVGDKVKGFEAGGVDYITKPFDPAEVLARVKTHIGLRRLQEHMEELVRMRTTELSQVNTSLKAEIAERTRAEEELRKSEVKYRELVANANSIILRMDNVGNVTFFNEFAQRFFGYSEDEIIGKNVVGTIVPKVESTGRDLKWMIEDIGLNPDRYVNNVNENMRCNGERVWIAWTNRPVRDESGRVTEILCVGNDITERKRTEEALRESEQRYRILTENASDIIWTMDLNFQFTFVSPSIERQQGWTVEEATSLSMQDVVTPNSLNMVMKVVEEELANEQLSNKDPKRTRTLEIEQYRKDGTIIWIEMTAGFLRDEEGNAIGIMGISREISERKKLESQIRQAQKMEAIGTLAGGIAHDFNNILSAIMGYTDLALKSSIMDSTLRRYLERVYQAGERARDLVTQILTFSRQTEQERRPVKVTVIVKEVLKLLRSSLPTTIEIHQDISTPPQKDVVLADPTQIHQVLMNLCTNAAHAMRVKGGVLGVSISEFDTDTAFLLQYPDLGSGSYIKLTVSDRGHGMDAAVLERIFEPYYTTKAPGEGTGLGLAVVQGIVKSHEGAISVLSEPGKGSIFHVFLPRHKEDLPSKSEEAERFFVGDERILFIDDEKVLADLGREMLVSLGYRVTATTSGFEALETFRSTPEAFDLVFTDMTMPKMTGTELAKECMNIRPGIPVILGTGFSEIINDEQAKKLGIRAFVLKPYAMKEIAKTIRKVLEKH